MTHPEISRYRLINQQIVTSRSNTPAEVVHALGAIQGQDYNGTLWAIALRLPNATEADVEQAIAARTIVRTWPMRGTLHFVAAADVRWMLELLTPRIIAASTGRWLQLELDAALFTRCRKLFTQVLQNNRQLSREALQEVLVREGITMTPQRSYHIFWRLAQEGTLCFGARAGKQPTFALLDEWAPATRKLDREPALAELAKRYFTSHGPATLRDFAGWSGLKISDACVGLDGIASQLTHEKIDGVTYWMPQAVSMQPTTSRTVHLLPGFDEYLLGYKDRRAVLDPAHAQKIVPGSNGVFLPTIVIKGQVAGIWKRTLTKKAAVITVTPFTRFKKADIPAIAAAADHYGEFLDVPVTVSKTSA